MISNGKEDGADDWKSESSSNEESSSDEGMEGSASPKNPFISEEVEDEDVEYEGDDEDEDEDEVREEEVEEDEDEDDDDDEVRIFPFENDGEHMKITCGQENLPSEHEGEEVSSSGDPSSNDDFFGPEGESTVSFFLHFLTAAYLNITKQLHDILALLHVAETGPGDL